MNLVEELGGYKKLRPHFILTDSALGYTHVYLHGNNHYCFLDDRVDYIIPERAFGIKDVIDALLEYRRQHNIYEVGDWIVSTLNLGSKPESMVCQIKFSHGGVVTTQSACGEVVNFYNSEFRHAEDLEVKVGRRLDLPPCRQIKNKSN